MANRDEGVAGPRAVWRIVRRRDFGPYFVGNALSASGTWFQNLAAALLIYRLTHSALLRHFGSAEQVLAASQEELEGVPGVPAKTARSIYAQLHKAGRA